MIEEITSLQNEKVKGWKELKNSRAARSLSGHFLAEGEHMAQEALKENRADALIICTSVWEKYEYLLRNAPEQIFRVSEKVINALSDAKTPQGILALCPLNTVDTTGGDNLMALDGVQDPGNVGTILRTLDAAAFSGLLLNPSCADPYSPKALRASMGAIFRIPIQIVPSLPEHLSTLRNAGYDLIAGDLHGEDYFSRKPFGDKLCFIIGNEGAGISDPVCALCNRRLKLPLPGKAESLNASVAAGIMIYDALREKMLNPQSQVP